MMRYLNVVRKGTETASTSGVSQGNRLERQSETESETNTDVDVENADYEENPQKKRKTYSQKFKDSWKTKFPWAQENNKHQTQCKVCKITICGSVTHLKRHALSKAHQNNIKACEKTPSLQTFCGTDNEESRENVIKDAKLKVVMFIVEHNLPLSLADHLTKLFNSICPNCNICKKISFQRKKCTQLCTNVIGPTNKEDIVTDLRNSQFSLIVDETTDISTDKSMAVVARCMKNNKVFDRFLDLIEVKSCTAKGLFESLQIHLFDKYNIPYKNMIGFGADNCSVMMGEENGLKALFQNVNSNIITVGCTCHSFHLCASQACQKLPSTVEQFCRDVYNYFSSSSKRLSELKECEIFCHEKPRSLLRPSQTRWLSLGQAVNRVLEHWPSLTVFFEKAVANDKLHSAQTVLCALKNPVYKLYFLFLSYILEIVNQLNAEFQSESPKIHLLLDRVTSLFKLILKSFMKKTYLDKTDIDKSNVLNPSNYLPSEEIYCGAKAALFINETNFNKEDLHNFRLRVLDFYIELSLQIKKRFKFNDKTLNFTKKFNPIAICSGTYNSISESLQIFPHLNLDLEKLDFEYRLVAETGQLQNLKDCDISEFYQAVARMKNAMDNLMFPNLIQVAQCIMCLPHSSAAAERIFSQLTLIKTKTRNRLLIKTCASLLHAKDILRVSGENCFTWKPPRAMRNNNNINMYRNRESSDEDTHCPDIHFG